MMSFPLVKYVLTAAARDRLIVTFSALICVSAALSVFLGTTGITEKDSFALVFGAAGLRFLSVLGLTLFSAFYIRRSFETKEVEFLLSRPVSRASFLASHAVAFIVLAAAVSLLVTVVVGFIGRPDLGGLFTWGISVFVENAIMITVTLFFAMVLTSASASALAAIGFYTLCRLIGTLLGIAALPAMKPVFIVLNNIMEIISVIIPRLDLMGQSGWLVYGVEGSGSIGFLEGAQRYVVFLMDNIGVTGFVVLQGIVFTGLFFSAAVFDFLRRQF